MSISCNNSLDCSIDGVVRLCYEEAKFSDDTNFCECSTWYGWKGFDKCDQYTGGLGYYRFSAIFIIILSAITMILAFRTILNNILFEQSIFRAANTLFFTVLFAFLSAFCLLVDASFTVTALFDPTRFEIYDLKSGLTSIEQEAIGVKHATVANIFLITSSYFQTLSALSLMVSWYSVIGKVARFESPDQVKKTKRWETWLKIFGAIYTILLFILLVSNYQYDAYILVAVVYIVASLVFLRVAGRFQTTFTTLQSAKSDDQIVNSTIALVLKVSKLTAACLVIVSLNSIIYAILNLDYTEKSVHGQFNYVVFLRDLGYLGIISMLLISTWYVNSVTEGAIMGEIEYCSCFFLWWDAKNIELFPDTVDESTLNLETFVS